MSAQDISSSLLGVQLDPVNISWSQKDAQLYAVAVGAQPETELQFVYEGAPGGLKVLPTYGVVPGLAIAASLMGKEDHVILLDCRSLSYKLFPLQLRGYSLVLVDTHVKHSLVDSEYNTRRAECERGVEILKQYYPEVSSLRDATEVMVRKHQSEMAGKVFDRCLYIVQEIARVQLASTYLEKHDLTAFGKCMFETHDGLSKLYQVSCKELDFLVEHARKIPGVIGSRMMGGGFGGCTINLVADSTLDMFQQQIAEAYFKAFAIHTEPLVVKVMDGVGVIESSIPKMRYFKP